MLAVTFGKFGRCVSLQCREIMEVNVFSIAVVTG